MANIEPYQYQKTTNIKEHNDIVTKVNEIIQVVNDTNLESIGIKFNSIDSEIAGIKTTDSLQWADIETLKSNDPVQDATLSQHTEEIKGLTDSSVSNVSIVDGYNMGTFKVRIDRKGTVSIDSNEYSLESPTSIELIQGTGPSMFKCQITLSDGRTLVSNDFVFTTEYIGQDIYISSFTFKAGNVDGTISADIGLSNGVTIEANNFAIPVQPTVSNAINDLNTRVQSLEDTTVSDARITNIETKNTEQDSAIEKNTTDIQFINTEIDGIKANISANISIKDYSSLGKDLNIIKTVNIPFTDTLTSNTSTNYAWGNPRFYDSEDKITAYNGSFYYAKVTVDRVPDVSLAVTYRKEYTSSDAIWETMGNLMIGKTAYFANGNHILEKQAYCSLYLTNNNNSLFLEISLHCTDGVVDSVNAINAYSNVENVNTTLDTVISRFDTSFYSQTGYIFSNNNKAKLLYITA